MTMQTLRFAGKIVSLAAVIALSATIGQAAEDEKEVFNVHAVNMSGAGRSGTTTFTITIDRWSSVEERNLLLTTLKEKGHDEFIKALRAQKEVGFVLGHGPRAARSQFPSIRLQYAFQSVEDGQREITLVTNRPISAAEAMSAGKSLDYDTSVVRMQFPAEEGEDKEVQGEGSLYRAVKVGFSEKTGHLDAEVVGNEAVRLTDIRSEKK